MQYSYLLDTNGNIELHT